MSRTWALTPRAETSTSVIVRFDPPRVPEHDVLTRLTPRQPSRFDRHDGEVATSGCRVDCCEQERCRSQRDAAKVSHGPESHDLRAVFQRAGAQLRSGQVHGYPALRPEARLQPCGRCQPLLATRRGCLWAPLMDAAPRPLVLEGLPSPLQNRARPLTRARVVRREAPTLPPAASRGRTARFDQVKTGPCE